MRTFVILRIIRVIQSIDGVLVSGCDVEREGSAGLGFAFLRTPARLHGGFFAGLALGCGRATVALAETTLPSASIITVTVMVTGVRNSTYGEGQPMKVRPLA